MLWLSDDGMNVLMIDMIEYVDFFYALILLYSAWKMVYFLFRCNMYYSAISIKSISRYRSV